MRVASDHQVIPECGAERGLVFIIEDHEMLAEALALGLEGNGFCAATAEFSDAESIFDQARKLRPSLVLLDLDLGGQSGLHLVSELQAIGTKVLVVTGSHDRGTMAAAFALGAVGWVSKTERFEVLLEKAEKALRGTPLLTMAMQEGLTRLGRERLEVERDLTQRLSQLTRREREVLASLCSGKCAKEIAKESFVSLGTVRNHIHAILAKLGVSTQLAAIAMVRNGPGGVSFASEVENIFPSSHQRAPA